MFTPFQTRAEVPRARSRATEAGGRCRHAYAAARRRVTRASTIPAIRHHGEGARLGGRAGRGSRSAAAIVVCGTQGVEGGHRYIGARISSEIFSHWLPRFENEAQGTEKSYASNLRCRDTTDDALPVVLAVLVQRNVQRKASRHLSRDEDSLKSAIGVFFLLNVPLPIYLLRYSSFLCSILIVCNLKRSQPPCYLPCLLQATFSHPREAAMTIEEAGLGKQALLIVEQKPLLV